MAAMHVWHYVHVWGFEAVVDDILVWCGETRAQGLYWPSWRYEDTSQVARPQSGQDKRKQGKRLRLHTTGNHTSSEAIT